MRETMGFVEKACRPKLKLQATKMRSWVSAMTPTDRILKIGTKLEKNGLKAFGAKTPSGHPAYFRSGGLQIIPSEAEEIDTGHSCRLVITPLAANLSSLVTDLINVLNKAPAGQQRAEMLVEEMKTKTFKDDARAGDWEVAAAKEIVSIALKTSERAISELSHDEPDDWSRIDPFTGEILEHRREDWRHAREILGRYASREMPKSARTITVGASTARGSGASDLTWLEVRAHLGVVVGGYWIPIGNATTLSGAGAQLELVKALRRKGLKPDIALTIIANARKRPKRTCR
jgi:hypothetical protein